MAPMRGVTTASTNSILRVVKRVANDEKFLKLRTNRTTFAIWADVVVGRAILLLPHRVDGTCLINAVSQLKTMAKLREIIWRDGANLALLSWHAELIGASLVSALVQVAETMVIREP